MGGYFRLLLPAALAWVGYVLFSEASGLARLEQPDPVKAALLYGGIVVDGLIIAAMVASWLVPAVGAWVGNFFFNPGEMLEENDHTRAVAKLTHGDPEGAIALYERILAKDPTDTDALSEIARICCRNLGDTARAAYRIEHALETDWPAPQSAFLANRLADIYLLQDDPGRARRLLSQVAQEMAGTKFATNAQQRLRELDHALATGRPAPIALEDVRARNP